MSTEQRQVVVVIVGAGPTGLAAANLLGQAGISTLLLERHSGLSDEPRAISLDDEGLRICQALGLSDAILPDILPGMNADYIASGHFLARVSPTSQRNGYPLISTFYQPTFEATLLQGLTRFSCVQTLFQHTLEAFEQDEYSVKLTIRNPVGTLLAVECRYLLACDGAHSMIRQRLGIALHPVSWRDLYKKQPVTEAEIERQSKATQRWLVIDGTDDDDIAKQIIFFCNPARPAVTVPAPHGRRRWEFMLLPTDDPAQILQTETIYALIAQARRSQPQYTQKEKMPALHITRQAIYTFHAMLASSFARDRIFLLGDAAHLMPPFGGQGMNSGLRDAYNLCWKLAMVVKGRAKEALLATYEQERHPHAARMILFSVLLGSIIMPTNNLIALLRNLFFRSLGTLPPLRTAFAEAHVKPSSTYTQGCLLSVHDKKSRHLVGQMFPQPLVTLPGGTQALLDNVLGYGFSLIRLSVDPTRAFLPLQSQFWSRLNVRFVCIQPAQLADISIPITHHEIVTVRDSNQHIGEFLHHNQNIYLLVRPDRYIMGVFHINNIKSFETVQNIYYFPVK